MLEARSVATVLDCENKSLVAIVEEADSDSSRGIIIVVGGPQYRVGSHRQFTLLSRDLALAGYTTMRFDQRGVGDSDGDTTFEKLGPDIKAAIDACIARYPNLKEVVLWGLCDAASAILMYAPTDPRVTGLVILNPWARSDQTMAQSYLSGYYVKRVFQPDFWRKLVSGGVNIAGSWHDFLRTLRIAGSPPGGGRSDGPVDSGTESNPEFQARMMQGLKVFPGQVLLILSGKDLTANEFEIFVNSQRRFRRLLESSKVRTISFAEADHTFSTAGWRDQVSRWTIEWLRSW